MTIEYKTNFDIIFIYVERKLSKLLYFLVCDKERLEEVYKGDEFMEKVVKEAKEIAGIDNLNLYFSEDEVQRLDREESYEKGFNAGKEEGFNAGIAQKEQEMVINLYNNNVPIEIISKSANLSIDEVNEIIQNSENKSN